MKKKTFRSLAALALSAAVVMSLGACSNDGEEIETVEWGDGAVSSDFEDAVEVKVGDVLFSNSSCTITLASVDTNSDDGYTLNLDVATEYEGSLYVTINAYDTSKYESYVEKAEDDKDTSISPNENVGYYITADDSSDDDTVPYEFSDEYIYYSIEIDVYDETITDDTDDKDIIDMTYKFLCSETIKLVTDDAE